MQRPDRRISRLDRAVDDKVSVNEVPDSSQTLLSVQYLLKACRIVLDDVDRRHVPVTEDAINKALAFAFGPHFTSLKIGLKVQLAIVNSAD